MSDKALLSHSILEKKLEREDENYELKAMMSEATPPRSSMRQRNEPADTPRCLPCKD